MELYTNTLLSSLGTTRNLNICITQSRLNATSLTILLCGKNYEAYLCDNVQEHNIQKQVRPLLGRIPLGGG